TPRESAAAWLPRAEALAPRPLGRVGRVLLIAAGAVIVAQYLAGYFFLWSLNADPRQATPLTIARYGYYFSGHEHVRTRLIITSSVGAALVILIGGAFLLPRRRSLHGDARFAKRREIAVAGLLSSHGIVLGRIGRRCLMLGGQQGVALAAPPRSGKGVGVVVPNALTWPGSLVCIDIKKENWTLTAGYRQKCGQDCFLFDPFAEDGNTAHWNPFFYVSGDPHRRVNDLQRIADMLYPDPPNVDPFWTASARSLFLGIALYLFETPSLPKTIGEVLRQGMASDDEGFGQHWKRVIEGRNKGRFPLSSQCVRALYDVIDLAPVTASSIRKTFTSRLDLWLNPMLDAATSANDFDLRDLRKRPLSIYVGVNPDDLHRLRPVLNLFFQQSIGLQTRELPERNPELKYQVMMLLDEFTALGRIPIIAESISYLPGYNVRVVLVIQTPAQLREVYGANGAETMLKSLAARIVFAPKDFPDAREISDELGFTTVPVKTLSRPAFDLGSGQSRRSRSISVSEQRRALLLPQEVKALGADDAIVFYEGLRPIRCKKIRYFRDRRFKERLLPPPAVAARGRPAAQSLSAAMTVSTPSPCLAGDVAGGGQDMQQVELEFRPPEAVREATLADIDRIGSLTLDDFAADFDKVKLPEKAEGERMTSEELQVAAESFLATLREH
ncbi:MAG TPA: type IV secretory system conjugative DNA transfer family protein, partial [Steroidobacteraceae bacterium]|nr:type IV secretory system conjugative DNA transfer family protein [Steroidobacteraceae bacterium]